MVVWSVNGDFTPSAKCPTVRPITNLIIQFPTYRSRIVMMWDSRFFWMAWQQAMFIRCTYAMKLYYTMKMNKERWRHKRWREWKTSHQPSSVQPQSWKPYLRGHPQIIGMLLPLVIISSSIIYMWNALPHRGLYQLIRSYATKLRSNISLYLTGNVFAT